MHRFDLGRPATDAEAISLHPLLMAAFIEILNLLVAGLERVDELEIVSTLESGEHEVLRLVEWAEAVRPIVLAMRGDDGTH